MTYLRLDRCTGPECPRCGCTDSEITSEPKPPPINGQQGWWDSGLAYCRACGNEFFFKEVPAPITNGNGHAPSVAVAPIDAPPEASDPPAGDYALVKKHLCPECKSDQVRVTHSLATVRRYQCKECKTRFKRARTDKGEQ